MKLNTKCPRPFAVLHRLFGFISSASRSGCVSARESLASDEAARRRASQTLQTELGFIAHQRLILRQLPRGPHAHVVPGRGIGTRCALCQDLIRANTIEYEVRALLDGAIATFRFHPHCHAAWERERARLISLDEPTGAL